MKIVKVALAATLPNELTYLARTAQLEGFTMVERLIENYHAGKNRFDRRGEALFLVHDGSQLIGAGGVNIDPYFADDELGRVRHLYIEPESRRRGIGRMLMQHIEQHASSYFKQLQLFTPTVAAAIFYEHLGYMPVSHLPRVSHVKLFNAASIF